MKKLRGIRLPDATTKSQAGERYEVVLPASGDVAKTFVPEVQPSSHIPEKAATRFPCLRYSGTGSNC
jgi:hypothetical protein